MIRLAKPLISDEAIKSVVDVLRSGNLVQGQHVKRFEQDIQEYLGIKHAIVVTSGTAALHLSLLALEIGPGDEVIIPSFSWPATINVVEIVGATPIMVDINLNDYCIDDKKIEQAITKKTKAIIPVHEFGYTADIDSIKKISKKYNLKIIEDAACALGSEYKDKKAGTFGELGCFSFHPRKSVTTGEGGVVVTNNEKLFSKIQALRNHGNTMNKKTGFLYAGLNYRMTDFQATLGIHQLKILDNNIEHNNSLAACYHSQLINIDWLSYPKKKGFIKHNYQSYHILLNQEISQNKFIMKMKDKGVETTIGAYSMNLLQFYKNKYKKESNSYVNSERAFQSGVVLPIGKHLNIIDINRICDILKSLYK